MKKNGFTLIEILATIIILATISLIAFPAVLNLLNSSNSKMDKAMQDLMISAASQYVDDHVDDFPKALENQSVKSYGTSGNLTGEKLLEYGYISDAKLSTDKNCEYLDDYVKVTSNSKKYLYEYIQVNTNSKC